MVHKNYQNNIQIHIHIHRLSNHNLTTSNHFHKPTRRARNITRLSIQHRLQCTLPTLHNQPNPLTPNNSRHNIHTPSKHPSNTLLSNITQQRTDTKPPPSIQPHHPPNTPPINTYNLATSVLNPNVSAATPNPHLLASASQTQIHPLAPTSRIPTTTATATATHPPSHANTATVTTTTPTPAPNPKPTPTTPPPANIIPIANAATTTTTTPTKIKSTLENIKIAICFWVRGRGR